MTNVLWRPAAGAAAAAVVILSLAACGSPSNRTGSTTDASGSSSASSSSSSSSASSSSSPSTSPTATAPETSTPAGAPEGLCSAAMLSGEVRDVPGGAAAGSVYRSLVVTNTSGAPCTLYGYPGVSYVDANGNQVGAPADRDPQHPRQTIELAPGASAAAVLKQTRAENYGAQCNLTPTTGVRVYPPSATDSLIAPQQSTGCANTDIVLMTVGAFETM